MIRLTVNGKEQELAAPTDVASFLRALGVNLQFIAVACNGEVLRREDLGRTVLKDGDVLEIVRPVGGG